ncbi:MAG: lipopolysaccharide biosynthesis protein, partial [Anaerolineales bacterium]
MRQTLKRFARLTAGYSLVALVGPLFTIFLTPLYTRALAPADYGVVEVAISLSAFVNAFVVFGMDQALSAHFFDGDATHQRRLVTTALVSVVGLGLLASLGLLATALPLAQFLFEDPGRRYILYLLAINSITAPVYTVILAGLRLQMGVRRVNLLALAFLAATITSNVVMVLGLRFKATGVIAANVIANVFACGLGLG